MSIDGFLLLALALIYIVITRADPPAEHTTASRSDLQQRQ
jgi:hypothetical protein